MFILLSFLCCMEKLYAQDSLFYNQYFFATDARSNASYFSIRSKEKVDSSKYTIKKFNRKKPIMKMVN